MSHDGAGIPEERIDKCSLETDPEKKGGTGLGLAIVKEVVEARGGQVTAEASSRREQLSRFVRTVREIRKLKEYRFG